MLSRKELANALRILAIDAVEHAQSGHPGAPMGMADMAESLWRSAFKHNPLNPKWVNRDRFILSNGHASMLLYGLLYLTGYDISIEDIKNFRQFGSKTPGHPELCRSTGVEMTTGPLGQGFATAVGMALGEKLLAQKFNRAKFPIIDHYTYVFLGDGCMMEGVSHEACSLAGTLKLSKLILLYDSNGISIDGNVNGWLTDDTKARFEACGWNVIADVDGHDADAVDKALVAAKNSEEQPTLICCKTIIGYGSPNRSNCALSHGSPLGKEETIETKKALNWKGKPFEISNDMRQEWDYRVQGSHLEKAWNTLYKEYVEEYPELAAEFERRMSGDLPNSWASIRDEFVLEVQKQKTTCATRISSKNVLDRIAPVLPELFGGSADLSGSVETLHSTAVRINDGNWDGNYLSYGVREFLMGAMLNGLALNGGFIPYGGTFLVFSDYARGAIRLSALMKQKVIWVLTHDSIGVGEDGRTHQPVEHLSSLRLIPDIDVWRPCDSVETAVAWRSAIEARNPTCLVLSRQNLVCQEYSMSQLKGIECGGYVLYDSGEHPEIILIATGSEVDLAVRVAQQLRKEQVAVRVVSMPCPSIFDNQSEEYKEAVLPSNIRKRIAIEAASADYWWKYVGLDGLVIGMNTFGESAPGGTLFQHFGFTEEHIISAVKTLIDN